MTATATAAPASRLVGGRVGVLDLGRIAGRGLGARRLRSGLTALGIAIGIAAMVAVLGIAESSRATLLAELDRIGSNLLTVAPGQTMFGEDATLPDEAVAMIGRIGPVEGVSAVSLTGATVRRTDRIPSGETGGIAVQGADPSLLETLEGSLAAGRFIDAAVSRYPTVVLGALAAERLGITSLTGQPLVWIADRWWAVVGILEPLPLAPEIDRSALVGMDAAREYLDTEASPTTIYVRAADELLDDVRSVLPATSNPEPRGGAREPAVGRDRSAGCGRDSVHDVVPWPRRGRAARRRTRYRQRHAHGRPRTAQRDRPAPGAGGHTRAHRWPVPHRGDPARGGGRCRGGGSRIGGRSVMPRRRHGSSRCRSRAAWRACWEQRRSGRLPGCTRLCGRQTWPRRTRSEPEAWRCSPGERSGGWFATLLAVASRNATAPPFRSPERAGSRNKGSAASTVLAGRAAQATPGRFSPERADRANEAGLGHASGAPCKAVPRTPPATTAGWLVERAKERAARRRPAGWFR